MLKINNFAKCSAANRGSAQVLNGNDLAKIILWNNKFICIGGNSVYFKTLAEKGIIKIGDLISDLLQLGSPPYRGGAVCVSR